MPLFKKNLTFALRCKYFIRQPHNTIEMNLLNCVSLLILIFFGSGKCQLLNKHFLPFGLPCVCQNPIQSLILFISKHQILRRCNNTIPQRLLISETTYKQIISNFHLLHWPNPFPKAPGFANEEKGCQIPLVIRNSWFSWENGKETFTEINADTMSNRGHCVAMAEKQRLHYSFVFQNDRCYYCVKLIVRTVNVLDKIESEFRTLRLQVYTHLPWS